MLAALSRAPVGLTSVRAVARRSGVSPTAAAGALERLVVRGLVLEERRLVAAGSARVARILRGDAGLRTGRYTLGVEGRRGVAMLVVTLAPPGPVSRGLRAAGVPCAASAVAVRCAGWRVYSLASALTWSAPMA